MSPSTLTASGLSLARNLAGRRFPHAEDADALEEAREEIVDALEASPEGGRWKVYDLQEISAVELTHFVERGLMTPRFAYGSGPGRDFAVWEEGEASLEINGDSHVRLLGFRVGDHLSELWTLLSVLDDRLELMTPWAFDTYWGYVASHPEQAGSGLRAYVTLQVPALAATGRLPGVVFEFFGSGVGLVPLWGGAGGVIQVSNLGCRGISEMETLGLVEEVANNIVEKEQSVRKMLFRSDPTQVKDHVGRALGMGQHAWNVSFIEAVNVISAVEVGLDLGLVEVPGMDECTPFTLIQELQPAYVIVAHMGGNLRNMEDPEIDTIRAGVLRKVFAGAYVR
ncbi:MAG: hypothetical protein ACOX8V_01965 [Thermoleophilia bacterium]|jgi:protein arginine kinase